MAEHMTEAVEIDGRNLTIADVAAVAREDQEVTLAPAARRLAVRAHDTMVNIAAERTVYGQNTGVGANKCVATEDDAGNGMRLVASHAGGAGPEISRENVRAMMTVRLNQLAVGGSGVNPQIMDTLATALNKGLWPSVRRYGAIGTGDLSALAATALCIAGDRSWQGGSLPPCVISNTDALAFISSGAATLGEAALASHDMSQLLRASTVVTALSFVALSGAAEAYDAAVQEARPHAGQAAVAAELRMLLGKSLQQSAKRVQDSYCLRAVPQVHGPAIEASERAEEIIETDINAGSENPLVATGKNTVLHNGNFHQAYLGLALDGLRAAVHATAALSTARLSALMEPGITGLRPFLADTRAGASGALILEYTAHSALAELRHLAAPDSIGSAVLSRGTEEHASFATQSAWQTSATVLPYETIVACELVAAVRALRQQNAELPKGPLWRAYDQAAAVLSEDMSDRSLEDDIAAAAAVLNEF